MHMKRKLFALCIAAAFPVIAAAASDVDPRSPMTPPSYDRDTGRSTPMTNDSRMDRSSPRADDADRDRSSAGSYLRDSEITAKVKAKLASERLASLTSIKVDTDRNGVVTLSGRANSAAEAKKAESIARNVEGVSAVENHIAVARNE
jgi:hyperosmotically inducible periplasmic protein